MTAPYVATVTKQPAGPAGRSRMQRTLLMVALLLPLLLAIALLAWMAVPKAGEGTGRADWMDRMFGKEEHGAGVIRIDGDEDVCSLPRDIGPCRGAMPRYFFSTQTGACETFLYGGCHGNGNNFETLDECTGRCGGPAAGAGERQTEQRVECSLPKTIGPCRGAMPRFFYSTESGACQSFLYGGCKGNANNFETIEECTDRCGGPAESSSERQLAQRVACSLPKTIGPCRGGKPRYFFNTESAACEFFLYGGCQGNANNFETMEECNSHCGVEESSPDKDDRE
ncbi:carboxypeptidase inhibitor SmCI-like [Amphibalanus amphitrite]|uniref:carboxypeptidase inhibitor SmCI-like n=1 Tax=Amphibalanus amphitrite TaxID=1232801 RepID=UPI001C91635C|nr:carboxypeptidase inhibitor SmCI-like [Amphibalanus amphitrite]